MAWARTFARSQLCALSIVRLYWPPDEAVRYGLDDPWDGSRRDAELLPLLERDLRRDTQADVAIGVADAIASIPPVSALGEKRHAELESQLRALIPSQAEAAGITTNISVIEARFAAEAIIAAAERLDVDLIAVASRGRSGFKRAVLGSVAEEVTRHSTRPVLLVRSQPPA